MADQEQVARLLAGVEEWNQWRRENRRTKVDLFRVDLSEARLSRANLSEARLSRANLSGANLSGANLSGANLSGANLSGAVLSQANIRKVDLSGADLRGADVSRAILYGAVLSGAKLSGVIFTEVQIGWTVFGAVDLRGVYDLDTAQHGGPSTLGIDTLYESGGQISETLLRGCGVPASMIEYARDFALAQEPVDYYSCFISYSSKDEALAQRLYADLQARGVRCWYAPHDMKTGESIIDSIDQAIRLHEKLLLILSESSVASSWVGLEVKTAMMREQRESRRVLFPIRLDDAVMQSAAGWAAQLQERHIGDFRQWKDHDAYQAAFARLLRDLKATPDR